MQVDGIRSAYQTWSYLPSIGQWALIRWSFLPDDAPAIGGEYNFRSSNWDDSRDYWPGYGEDGSLPLSWVNGQPPPFPPLHAGTACGAAGSGTQGRGFVHLGALGVGSTPSSLQSWALPYDQVGGLGIGSDPSSAQAYPYDQAAGVGSGVDPASTSAYPYAQTGGVGGGSDPSATSTYPYSHTGGIGPGSGPSASQGYAYTETGGVGPGGGLTADAYWQRAEATATQRSGSSSAAVSPAYAACTTGDTLVLALAYNWGSGAAATFTVTDDQGNTWSRDHTQDASGLVSGVQLWHAVATTGTAPTLTVTPSKAVTLSYVLARYYPPKPTIAKDASSGQQTTANTNVSTGAATSTPAGDLWVAVSETQTGGATAVPSVSTGFTRPAALGVAASKVGIALGDFGTMQTVAASGTATCIFVYAVNVNAVAAIVSIKAT